MFRIGDFARMVYLPVSTLRYYDECGLLKPSFVDAETGYRYYAAEQLQTVGTIQAMKEAGLSLAEIRDYLDQGLTRQGLISLLRHKEAVLHAALRKEQERLRRLNNWIIAITEEGSKPMTEVTIKHVAPMLVAGLRETIPGFENIGKTWKTLNEEIDRHPVSKVIPCMMLYHNGGENGLWDIEVVEPINKPFAPEGGVRVYTLPGSERMASIVHHGPFETIGETFAAIHAWFAQNGYKAGMGREIYHKGDWMTEDPREYITEIQMPIL